MRVFTRGRATGAKIEGKILVSGDQWGKMSLRDVRKENMTGFWNILKVKNKAYSVEKKYKSSLHKRLRSSPRGEPRITPKLHSNCMRKRLKLPESPEGKEEKIAVVTRPPSHWLSHHPNRNKVSTELTFSGIILPWPTEFCWIAAGRKGEENGRDLHSPYGPEIRRTASRK